MICPPTWLQRLGTIQSGLEIGALARTTDGRYLQVNGSILRDLHPTCVKAAIERARHPNVAPRSSQPGDVPIEPAHLPAGTLADRPAPRPPTIVYRKRRLATCATCATCAAETPPR